MSKKRGLPDDLISQTMGGTKASQDNDMAPDSDAMKLVQIRLPPSMKDALMAHFKARGLGLSTGIRSVLADYLARR